MISYIKQRLLIFLEEKGWRRHPKERSEFQGYPIHATKGVFTRALSVCAESLIFNNLSARVSFVNAFVGSSFVPESKSND